MFWFILYFNKIEYPGIQFLSRRIGHEYDNEENSRDSRRFTPRCFNCPRQFKVYPRVS